MAKNTNDYDQMQANIRKAKGNPNKNVHHKKNNSNYKGYVASKQAAEAAKNTSTRPKQPLWVTLTMIGVFIVLIVIVILMNGALKGNEIFAQGSMVIIGSCCGIIAYLNRFSPRENSKLQKGIGVVLTVMAIIYIFMGGYGLIQVL